MLGGLARDGHSQAGVGCTQGAVRWPPGGSPQPLGLGHRPVGDGQAWQRQGLPSLGLRRCQVSGGSSTPPVQKHLEWPPSPSTGLSAAS